MSLKTVAWISGGYDLALAVAMLFFAGPTAALFGSPAPVPLVNAQLNGVFTLTLAVGYFWAAGDVEQRRGYFWIAGVLAKGLGAALFVADHLAGRSPASFLLFALSDGGLALLTLALLWRAPSGVAVSTPPPRPASGTPRG
jgi:hypothetical protein